MRDEIAKAISKATGKKVENKLTTDYTIAIAALENGDAQLGWFGPNRISGVACQELRMSFRWWSIPVRPAP